MAERSIPTVLLVDHDARVLAAGKSGLGGTYRVLTARSVADARAQCARESIQAAIVELRLGAGCGLDLLRALKRDHATVRTALFTGDLSYEVTAEAALAGARVIASRPYPLRRLLSVLETSTRDVVVLQPPPLEQPPRPSGRSASSRWMSWSGGTPARCSARTSATSARPRVI